MRLNYVSNDDDWVAVYVGGLLMHEGHDIPRWVWMDLVMMDISSTMEWYCDFEIDGMATERFGDMLEKDSMRRVDDTDS